MERDAIYGLAHDYVEIQREELDAFRDESGKIQCRTIDDHSRRRKTVWILKQNQELEWMLQYLRDEGLSVEQLLGSQSDLKVEINRLRNVLGDELDDAIREEFDRHYNLYPGDVCTIFEFEPVTNETPNSIDNRDTLQFLYEDLDIEDPKIEEGMRVLDEVLKHKYENNPGLVRELNLERPYMPNHYWWRHPEEFLTGT